MDKLSALAIYVIVVILIFILAYLWGIRIWSSLALALLVGIIVLFILTPQNSFDNFKDNDNLVGWIYLAIWVITFLILLFYLLDRIFRDRVANQGCVSKNFNYLIPSEKVSW